MLAWLWRANDGSAGRFRWRRGWHYSCHNQTLAISTMTKKISLIYNPVAGAVRRDPGQIARLEQTLREHDIEVEPLPTVRAGHATELAAQAVREGAETIVVCGGDGTINETAQSLIGTPAALAVWPSGTANVLAKELRLPRAPQQLARLIAEGRTRTISVGRAAKPETDWQRYFLLMAGIGIDATIVQSVNLELKRRAGVGAYVAAGAEYLARLPLTPFMLDCNGQRHESIFTVIANAANYAAWFRLAPCARMDDDELYVCSFNSRSRVALLGYAFLSIAGGNHTRSPGVLYQSARVAVADSATAALVQLDGEVVGQLPMKFEIVPQALRVVAPLA